MKDSINTYHQWLYEVQDLLLNPSNKKSIGNGELKFSHKQWFLEGPIDESIKLGDFYYNNINSKASSLKNAYFNKDSLDRAKKRLKNMRSGSVNISLTGNEKTYTKQDHCMVSMVIFKKNGKYEVTVFYRTTEFCKKFLADLVFLRDEIFPYLGIKDYDTNFYFTRLDMPYHYMWIPIVLWEKFVPGWHKAFINNSAARFKFMDFFDKMDKLKERGSSLRSHYRHWQMFKKEELYQKINNTFTF